MSPTDTFAKFDTRLRSPLSLPATGCAFTKAIGFLCFGGWVSLKVKRFSLPPSCGLPLSLKISMFDGSLLN